jgi:hypothetical protein
VNYGEPEQIQQREASTEQDSTVGPEGRRWGRTCCWSSCQSNILLRWRPPSREPHPNPWWNCAALGVWIDASPAAERLSQSNSPRRRRRGALHRPLHSTPLATSGGELLSSLLPFALSLSTHRGEWRGPRTRGRSQLYPQLSWGRGKPRVRGGGHLR